MNKEKCPECNDTGEVFDEIDKTLGLDAHVCSCCNGLKVQIKKLQIECKNINKKKKKLNEKYKKYQKALKEIAVLAYRSEDHLSIRLKAEQIAKTTLGQK